MRPSTSVVTRMKFAAPPEQVWDGLMFYEEIDSPPPLYLRLFLPVPIRIEGRKSAVGDETTCVYRDGHLLKRVTRIDAGRHYGFDVVEQNLAVGGTILSGGCYALTRASGTRHRSRDHDAIREPQAARLAMEADRGDGVPHVPPSPAFLDAAKDRVGLTRTRKCVAPSPLDGATPTLS